jgi:hypothetical protein
MWQRHAELLWRLDSVSPRAPSSETGVMQQQQNNSSMDKSLKAHAV